MNVAQFQKLCEQRPDLAKYFHYVRGSRNQGGYYRRIPPTYYNRRARPATLLRSQIAFGEAAYDVHGTKGLSEEGLPVAASSIKKRMRGKQFRKSKVELVIEKLGKAMEKAAEVATKEI